MVAQYCKEVKAAVKGDRNYKNNIIKNLEADLEEYLSDHPDATAQAVREYFGAPEDYARELDATAAPAEKAQSGKLRRRVLTAVIATAVAVVLIWAGAVIYEVVHYSTVRDGYSFFADAS